MNASMHLILLQDIEAKVQGSQYEQCLCYFHSQPYECANYMGSRWFEACAIFCYNGLGTSRVSRRGECHDTTMDSMGWADERTHGLDQDQENGPISKGREHKHSTPPSGRVVEGPDSEPAMARSARVEASDCSRLASARLYLLPLTLLPPSLVLVSLNRNF
jgi:hypothetical protein